MRRLMHIQVLPRNVGSSREDTDLMGTCRTAATKDPEQAEEKGGGG